MGYCLSDVCVGYLAIVDKGQFMIRRNTSFSQHRCAFASNLRRRLHISHVLRLESKMATAVKSEEGRDTRGCRPRFVRNQSLISTRFARPRHGADIPGKQCEAGSGPSTTGIDSKYTVLVGWLRNLANPCSLESPLYRFIFGPSGGNRQIQFFAGPGNRTFIF